MNTIEEKAKAYDDALERAKRIKDGKGNWRFSDLSVIEPAVTEIFPVLKEFEDERIRKHIIEILERLSPCHWDGNEKSECIAYLEKQKEPLTPEEKMNHPLYLEGFDVGRKVGQVEAEQKPAEWSEEDEKMLKCCLIAINHYEKTCNIGDHLPTKFNIGGYLAGVDKVKSWLKSLPERFNLQPKQEWSEEEKRKLNRIYQILGWAADTHAYSTTRQLIGDKEAIELQDFLRSIVKPTINLAEWSDEENINTLIAVIKAHYNDFPINARGLVDWLKSLLSRPKSSDNLPKWKKASAGTKLPSESVIRRDGEDPRFGSVAVYDCEYITVNDLEKLTKED